VILRFLLITVTSPAFVILWFIVIYSNFFASNDFFISVILVISSNSSDFLSFLPIRLISVTSVTAWDFCTFYCFYCIYIILATTLQKGVRYTWVNWNGKWLIYTFIHITSISCKCFNKKTDSNWYSFIAFTQFHLLYGTLSHFTHGLTYTYTYVPTNNIMSILFTQQPYLCACTLLLTDALVNSWYLTP